MNSRILIRLLRLNTKIRIKDIEIYKRHSSYIIAQVSNVYIHNRAFGSKAGLLKALKREKYIYE